MKKQDSNWYNGLGKVGGGSGSGMKVTIYLDGPNYFPKTETHSRGVRQVVKLPSFAAASKQIKKLKSAQEKRASSGGSRPREQEETTFFFGYFTSTINQHACASTKACNKPGDELSGQDQGSDPMAEQPARLYLRKYLRQYTEMAVSNGDLVQELHRDIEATFSAEQRRLRELLFQKIRSLRLDDCVIKHSSKQIQNKRIPIKRGTQYIGISLSA